MRTHRSLGLSLVIPTLAIALVAPPSLAREQAPGLGSAIALSYSIEYDVFRPGEARRALLCLTNQNPHSARDVDPGDSFAFTFRSGAVADCAGLTMESPSGDLEASDFDCAIDGLVVRLRYLKPTPSAWPFGDTLCASIALTAGSGSGSVLSSMAVRNQGAFAPPTPAAILLSVGTDLGSVGPTGATGPMGSTGGVGPIGPTGRVGATGPDGLGAVVFARSSGAAQARENEPPVLVPGLDVTVNVAEGSRLEILTDSCFDAASRDPSGQGRSSMNNVGVVLELDGGIIARRDMNNHIGGQPVANFNLSLVIVTDALPAGSHRVRLLVDAPHPADGSVHEYTSTVGSGSDLAQEARLLVRELLARP